MLLPYICPITMLQLRGVAPRWLGSDAVGEWAGRRQQEVDGRSFDARWASGREVVCGEGLGCGLVGVDARMLQPVARAKRRTGGAGQRRGGTGRVLPGKPWNGRLSCQVEEREGKKKEKNTPTARKCREKADAQKGRLSQLPGMGGMLSGREVNASGKDGVCVWAEAFCTTWRGTSTAMLSAPASASRLGAQSTNDDPHARLPAAMLWSRTATT